MTNNSNSLKGLKYWVPILLIWIFGTKSIVVGAEEIFLRESDIAGLLKMKGEWIVNRWEQRMGVGEQCAAGASYIFDIDRTLRIQKCENKKIMTTNCKWSISQGDNGIILELCQSKYFVRAKIDKGITMLRLTTLSTEKDELEQVVTMKFIPE